MSDGVLDIPLRNHRNKWCACFVYFVEGAGKIKIGKSSDPARRLSGMQVNSPVPLTLLATIRSYEYEIEELEKLLHARFADCHSHGEWFHATETLRRYVERVRAELPALGPPRGGRAAPRTYNELLKIQHVARAGATQKAALA